MSFMRIITLTFVLCVVAQHYAVQAAPSPQDFHAPTSDFVSRFMTNLSEYVRNLIYTAGDTASNAIGGGPLLNGNGGGSSLGGIGGGSSLSGIGGGPSVNVRVQKNSGPLETLS